MPTNLVWATEQFGSAERRAWLAELPATIAALADRWSLSLGTPYQPGGQCSWVAPARDDRGRELVLKVGWTHDEGRYEADGLRVWTDYGAVAVHGEHVDGPTTALLLERCDPGTELGKAMPEDEQDVVVAEVLARLWQAPTDGPFRPLEEMCHAWADEFEQKLADAVGYDLDRGLVRAGVELFRELPASAGRTALLATDLHAGNILAARRMPWLIIDPKPYVGDPMYDPLQHMLNRSLRPDPGAVVRRMAGLLDLDAERLRLWLFARCVVESIDWPQAREVAPLVRPR